MAGKLLLLRIPYKLPSLNDYIGACRTNPYKGAMFKREIEEGIQWEIKSQFKGYEVELPVMIKYYWYEPNKRRDLDNIASAHKYIQDALVNSKVLRGDSQRYIVDIKDYFFTDKTFPRVMVAIKELDERDVKLIEEAARVSAEYAEEEFYNEHI